MIKVIVKNAVQAIEVINSFKNTNDLTFVIKENTATENSDVRKITLKIDVDTDDAVNKIKVMNQEFNQD